MVEMYGYVQPISRNIEIHMLQMLFICYSFVKMVIHFSFIQDAFLDAKKKLLSVGLKQPRLGHQSTTLPTFLGWQFMTLSKDGWRRTSCRRKKTTPRHIHQEQINNYVHTPAWNRIIKIGIPLTYPNNSFHLTTS